MDQTPTLGCVWPLGLHACLDIVAHHPLVMTVARAVFYSSALMHVSGEQTPTLGRVWTASLFSVLRGSATVGLPTRIPLYAFS